MPDYEPIPYQRLPVWGWAIISVIWVDSARNAYQSPPSGGWASAAGFGIDPGRPNHPSPVGSAHTVEGFSATTAR
jgi:hypothetical protein